MKNTSKAFLSIALIAFLYSCKDEYTICNESKNVNFKAGFYRKVSGADVATPVPGLTVLINGLTIYNNQPSSALVLPLNPVVDSTKYSVSLNNGAVYDTVTIVYTTRTVNLSYDCGNIIFNKVTKFYSTTHEIDSVRITKADVTNDALENAKIWY